MPIEIIRTDITTLRVDAIVNAANSTLLGGGGVDGAIHKAAGPGLLAECRALGGCAVGDAKITGGYRLPCKYVIHTVGPIWQNGFSGEEAQLRSCYARSLALADRHSCRSVAFPLISSGAFGYPKAQALRVAMDEISSFLLYHDMQVYVVVYSQEALRVGEQLYAHIAQYIDDCYVAQRMTYGNARGEVQRQRQLIEAMQRAADYETYADSAPASCMAPAPPARAASEPSLAELLKQLDESFTQMLLRKIDERGMTDPQCYKRANIDRKLFAKIRGNIHYQPSKRTALALAIALELSLAETQDLLAKAGYALSHASEFDVIIEYFILHGQYNIHQINQALFAFDQPLLGA